MKKKKAVIIILSVLLVLIIAGGSAAAAVLPHPLNYKIKDIQSIGSTLEVVSKEEDCVTVRNTEDRDFKVITFTDTHLDGKNKTSYVTVSKLVENIEREKPDLVILGGDNVTSGMNRKRANQLAQIFENLGVYWAGILGNHEGDNKYSVSRPEMMDIFTSYEHCLMCKGPEDIWGDCNYSLNILNSDGSLCETFVFMDTGDEVSEETKTQYGIPADESPYDGVKTNQVEWYESVMTKTKETYGDFSSIVVVHIPLPQYKTAAENQEFVYGDKREGICCSGFDSGLFDAIKKYGSTKAVFCGHDHLNDFGVMCDGVLLGYMQPSGYGSYSMASKFGAEEKDWLQGYMILSLSPDGTFAYEHHRNSEFM